MKGSPDMISLPLTSHEASRLYFELAKRGAKSQGLRRPWRFGRGAQTPEALLALAFAQSRYDPRLAAVLVDFFRSQNVPLDPLAFKRHLTDLDALSAAAALGELIRLPGAPDKNRDLFRFLASVARPVPMQLFYRNLYPVAGYKMREAAERPLRAFRKWGYLAHDAPLLKETRPARWKLYDKPTRLDLLRELVASQGAVRLRDYLRAVGHSISRQRALLDIREAKTALGLKRRGMGRGTVYKLAKGSKTPSPAFRRSSVLE